MMRFWFALAATAFFTACSSPKPFAAVCVESDECEEGLTCLPLAQFDGEACEEVGAACSVACEDDDDCADFEGALCFASCTEGEKSCGATG